MQSRRRFFCARVELVQLARAFLCPSAGHAGTMDRAQEPQPRDGGAQVDTAAPGASCTIYPRPQPPQRAHRATQPGKGTGTQASPETGHRAAHRGRTGASNPQPREQYRRKRPQMPHRAAPGGGAIPILPAAKTPPQRRTEPPTEGKPPGVQKRRGEQAHSRHSPGTAPRAKIRAVFCDFSGDFLRFFPALSRSRGEFHSRKSIVESRLPPEVGAGLIVGKSLSRSAPRPHSPKVAWSGRRRCTSPGFHRLNTRFPVQRSE